MVIGTTLEVLYDFETVVSLSDSIQRYIRAIKHLGISLIACGDGGQA